MKMWTNVILDTDLEDLIQNYGDTLTPEQIRNIHDNTEGGALFTSVQNAIILH